MIEFCNVTLGHDEDHLVLRDVSCVIPTDRRFVLFSDGGEGKTVFLKGLSGLLQPLQGEIRRYRNLSFPLGHTGGFQDELTIEENIRFTAAAFETNPDELVAFVRSFPGMEEVLGERYRGLPSSVQIRISYAIAYGLPFDCFLIDGPVAVGDQPFREACAQAFQDRCGGRFIMTTRHVGQIVSHADCGAILKDGELEMFDDIKTMIRKARSMGTRLPRAI